MRVITLNKSTVTYFADLCSIKDALALPEGEGIYLGVLDDSEEPYLAAGILYATVVAGSISVDWLYVDPELRRKGVGTALVDNLLNYSSQAGVSEVYLTFSQSNEGMHSFLDKFGFPVLNQGNWHKYEAKLKDFRDMKTENLSQYTINSFMRVGDDKVRMFNNFLEKADVRVGVPMPIDPRDYSAFSVCARIENRIVALLLVNIKEEDDNTVIELPWVYVDRDGILSIPLLYKVAFSALRRFYAEDTVVRFETVSQNMESILEKIVPNATFEEVYIASWPFV